MNNTFKNHQSAERKEKLIRAWQYMKPWQRAWIYIRVMWWSLPTIIDTREHIHNHFNIWMTRFLYKAHWVNYGKS
jgi:hypothetical protein